MLASQHQQEGCAHFVETPNSPGASLTAGVGGGGGVMAGLLTAAMTAAAAAACGTQVMSCVYCTVTEIGDSTVSTVLFRSR